MFKEEKRNTFIDMIPNLYHFEKQILNNSLNHDSVLDLNLFPIIYVKLLLPTCRRLKDRRKNNNKGNK